MPWVGLEHGEPSTEIRLAFSLPLCLPFWAFFPSFLPLLWFRAFLPGPSSPSVPFPGHNNAACSASSPSRHLHPPLRHLLLSPARLITPALTVLLLPLVFARSSLFAWIKVKNLGCSRLGVNGEEGVEEGRWGSAAAGSRVLVCFTPSRMAFWLFHHRLSPVKDISANVAEWLLQSGRKS